MGELNDNLTLLTLSKEVLEININNSYEIYKFLIRLDEVKKSTSIPFETIVAGDVKVILDTVKVLRLSDKELENLPESIGQLTNLMELGVSTNKLTNLPESIGQLTNLSKLDVSSNKLTSLPESIGKLTNLSEFDVRSNKLTSLPESIGQLTNLSKLMISSNHLTSLPESIGKLINLSEFDVRRNCLSSLPDIFGSFNHLRRVYISLLNIDFLPVSLVQLNLPFINDMWDNFDGIYIRHTKLSQQDITMFINNDRALIDDWYRAHLVSETMKVYESKVIFLGDGDVGKTYSIKRLFLDGIKETEETKASYATTMTHGIIIKNMEMQTESGDPYTLHFWDFGGQAIMHSMHRCFLTRNACYVVMISTRNDRDQMEQARYWLRNVQAFAGDAPVILYVNRWSKMSDRLDIDRLISEFPQNLRSREHIIFLNAKDSSQEEFLGLKKLILRITSSLSCYGMEVPISWNSIQNELLRLCHEDKKCIIDQEKYHAICTQYQLMKGDYSDEEEEELQVQLLEWFNNTGVCFSYHMNYNRQPLKRYKVLNPEWLTNAIYLLIMQGGSYALNGVLPLRAIQSILKHPEDGESGDLPYMQGITYNSEQCEYICEVMRKYQLSYKTEDGEFIPALCNSSRPSQLMPEEYDAKNLSHKHITYVMKYSYLPDTVIQRLMILLKDYRSASEFWNKGLKITLKDMNLMAVIDMGSGDRNLVIDIYTTGSTKPYEFLPAIHERLRQINEKLNLIPEEEIWMYGENGKTEILLAPLLNIKRTGMTEYFDYITMNRFSIDEVLVNVFGKDIINDYEKKVSSENIQDTRLLLSQMNDSIQRILNEKSKDSEHAITQYVIKALMKMQENSLVNNAETDEDQFNDQVRDFLDMIYPVKDQTRAGKSESGKKAGEIDIAICHEGKKLALYEAQILSSVSSDKIKEHINKLIENYNPSGVKLLYHVVYARVIKTKFASFCNRYHAYLEKCEYPYPVSMKLEEVEDDATAFMRHMKLTLSMEEKPAVIHFFVVKVN